MGGFYALRYELKERFQAISSKTNRSQEKFIEFVLLALRRSNKYDIKPLEVILDLSLALVEDKTNVDVILRTHGRNTCDNYQTNEKNNNNHDINIYNENNSKKDHYDADDESFDVSYIFPCHLTGDNCHPDQVYNYHYDHFKTNPHLGNCKAQIIKHKKVCEFVIQYLLQNIRSLIKHRATHSNNDDQIVNISAIHSTINQNLEKLNFKPKQTDIESKTITEEPIDLDYYLNTIINLVTKLEKVCILERTNCRILAKTNITNQLLQITHLLVKNEPEKQDIYLNPLLSVILRLANHKIQGNQLRKLFIIAKEEDVNLDTFLQNLFKLLALQNDTQRNIQPFSSINFPLPSTTANELYNSSFISNCWHWRLRRRVLEFKKRQFRDGSDKHIYKHQDEHHPVKKANDLRYNNNDNINNNRVHQRLHGDSVESEDTLQDPSNLVSTPSWLECSLMTPISSITPLIDQDGHIRFTCSLWLSICGDLFVASDSKPSKQLNQNLDSRWRFIKGHWLRLITNRRLGRRRISDGMKPSSSTHAGKSQKSSKPNPSSSNRTEDSDDDGRKKTKNDIQIDRGFTQGRLSQLNQIRTKIDRSTEKLDKTRKNSKKRQTSVPKTLKCPPREVMLHIISFALDTLTIELWLNVKNVQLTAKACRVGREGQTVVLDCAQFISTRFESTGKWTHLVVSLEETICDPFNQFKRCMLINLTLDATNNESAKLTYNTNKNPFSNFACLIGSERSTFGYVWKLSQVNVYKTIPTKELILYLYGKGPDFWTFSKLTWSSSLILPDILKRSPSKLLKIESLLELYGQMDQECCLNWITENVVSVYVAHRPTHFLDYSQNNTLMGSASHKDMMYVNNAERYIEPEILNFSRNLRFNTNQSIGAALCQAGGIESMLVFFADIVRRCPGQTKTHSLALSVLLKMSESNQHHLFKFLDELDGLKLVGCILGQPTCLVSKSMFDVFFDYCVIRGPNNCHLIKSSKLLSSLLGCWQVWHKDTRVAKRLYRRIHDLLLQPELFKQQNSKQNSNNPWQGKQQPMMQSYHVKHNIMMMNEAGGIDILVNILKQCLIPMEDIVPKIDQQLISYIVNVMSLLINHPPGLDVIYDLMEFLMFLHPEHRAYVDAISEKTFFLHSLKAARHGNVTPYDDHYRGDINLNNVTSEDNLASDGEFNSYQSSSIEYVERINHYLDGLSDPDGKLPARSYSSELHKSAHQFTSNQQRSQEYTMDMTSILGHRPVEYNNSNETPHENINQLPSTNRAYADPNTVDDQHTDCRSFALASVADMLASIVKLTPDTAGVLSEVFIKPIIDPRKLIILVNNNSPIVREKVLRLFLYSLKACYSLNLRSVLAKFEHDEPKNSKFKVSIPIQLMSRQLLRFPTTMKMIQLCYSVIVGVDDFEAVESFCFSFGLDAIDDNFKFNILLLLIQIMTQLEKPRDILSAVRFTYMSVKRLLEFSDKDMKCLVLKENLMHSLMTLYFTYVELISNKTRWSGKFYNETANNNNNYEQQAEEMNQDESMVKTDLKNMLYQLDKTLIMIIRYFMQNLPTSEAIDSLEDIMTYLTLMNSYVHQLAPKNQFILRDCQVKILSACLEYCKLYETDAEENLANDKMGYYITSLFKNGPKFDNFLTESQLELAASISKPQSSSGQDNFEGLDDKVLSDKIAQENNNNLGTNEGNLPRHYHRDDGNSTSTSCSTETTRDGSLDVTLGDDDRTDVNSSYVTITESDLLKRYKAIVTMATHFITTREQGIIPSHSERKFILKLIEFLVHFLDYYENTKNSTNPRSLWTKIAINLEATMRENFSCLILYLLSPCDSMNPDERKYYAQELLYMFNEDHLLSLLDDDSHCNLKILLLFIQDLIHPDFYVEDDTEMSENEEEVFAYDTESRFKFMLSKISEILAFSSKGQKRSTNLLGMPSNGISSSPLDAQTLMKLKDIWLNNLHQLKEETRERCTRFENNNKNETYSNNPSSIDSSILSTKSVMIMDEGLRITHDVVNDKHEQRKTYLEDLKQDKVYDHNIRQHWLSLIIGQTHERSVWFMDSHYPKSWELNPVEGPSRIRRRLRPTKLTLADRFFRRTNQLDNRFKNHHQSAAINNTRSSTDDWHYMYSQHPLCSLVINPEQSDVNVTELRARMFTTDKIHFNCDCSIIRPNEVCEGEISIASWCMHFIGERNSSPIVERSSSHPYVTHNSSNNIRGMAATIVEDLWFDEIVEVLDRRYQLRDVGLEIFLTNNMTYLLSFKNNHDRENFRKCLFKEQHKMINLQKSSTRNSSNLNKLTQLWREGQLTNFDYLTCLNKLAGRSFNDLMQYPIFPFVLSNYVTDQLDLTNVDNFRNLKRPMAVQNADKEVTFRNNYHHHSTNSNISIGIGSMTQPYHYGNHYSNTASVLHFLVRLPPFTQMMIQYQDDNFDQPDRTFHSIANTWQLITRDSNTDFKELIPEFFFLPEMFINFEQFELGRKQNDELVDYVRLPPWTPRQDPRLFTLIHRQALECDHVTADLHNWIDLIFGYKQTGKAAVEALNVYHPATYYGMVELDRTIQTTNGSDGSSLITVLMANSPRSSTNSSAHNLLAHKSQRQIQDQQQQVHGSSLSCHKDTNNHTDRSKLNQDKRLKLPNSNNNDNQRKASEADIERLAVETMIKTYGQMPKQLYVNPMQPKLIKPSLVGEPLVKPVRYLQPLQQVLGLRWGSYVGSPDELDIVAIKHKFINGTHLSNPLSSAGGQNNNMSSNHSALKARRYKLELLPNGDIAILNEHSSLLLDYRADRKSGASYQLSFPTRRWSRRAGLSNVARINLFSNMIISRQQFANLESSSNIARNSDLNNASSSSIFTTLGTSKNRFTLDTLSKISWSHLDGTIRIRHPANNQEKPSVPLLQADSIIDTMSICVSVPELNLLLIGYESGATCAHIISTSFETISSATYFGGGPTASSNVQSSGVTTTTGESRLTSTRDNNATISRSSSNADLAPDSRSMVSSKSSSHKSAVILEETKSQLLVSGKTIQTVRSVNKATRWLYCHRSRVNCIRINISFGVVVTASDDGTTVIWDLNSLSYVRTINYAVESSTLSRARNSNINDDHRDENDRNDWMSQFLCNCEHSNLKYDNDPWISDTPSDRCQCCRSGVLLLALSNTLGDIVSVKRVVHKPLRPFHGSQSQDSSGWSGGEGEGDEHEASAPCLDVIYVHTINGGLVGLVNSHTQVSAVAYSNAPEGVSVNVIAVGLVDGVIRLYSSWDLTRVKEFHMSGLNLAITSLLYSKDNQLLYTIYENGELVVLSNKHQNGSGSKIRKRNFSHPNEIIM